MPVFWEELHVWKMTCLGELRSLTWFLVEQNMEGNICIEILFLVYVYIHLHIAYTCTYYLKESYMNFVSLNFSVYKLEMWRLPGCMVMRNMGNIQSIYLVNLYPIPTSSITEAFPSQLAQGAISPTLLLYIKQFF